MHATGSPTLRVNWLAVSFALLLLALMSTNTVAAWARQTDQPTARKVGKLTTKFYPKRNRAVLFWKGKIDRPMASQFRSAIDKWKSEATGGFVISLDSKGGRVRVAYEVAKMLRQLRQTHRVTTHVGQGRVCGSSCVPIFLQGERRSVAFASLWLFHQITSRNKSDPRRLVIRNKSTNKMFSNYFAPAGVPSFRIKSIKQKIDRADYWMTGAELLSSGSKIGTHFLSNRKRRRFKASVAR